MRTAKTDQTGWMPRLIWVFAGHTVTLLVLSCRGYIFSLFWRNVNETKHQDKQKTWSTNHCDICKKIILSFRTDMHGQRSSLIRVYTVCHFVCIVWTHYSMVELQSSNFRVITTNFLGVRIFRKFTVVIISEDQWSCITHLRYSFILSDLGQRSKNYLDLWQKCIFMYLLLSNIS